MEELLNQISTEIYKHSLPRPYDWFLLMAMVASIVVAILVARYTYKIYIKQLELMCEQKEIAKKQTSISEKQSEIMEQQNKIALFEKRSKYYKQIELIFHYQYLLFENIDDDSDSKSFFNCWIEHFNTPLMVDTFRETESWKIASEVEREYHRQEATLNTGEFVFSENMRIRLHEVHTTYLDLFRCIINATFYKEEFRQSKMLNFANKLEYCLTRELLHEVKAITKLY